MKYKVIQKRNPQKPEEAKKYYATPVWDGKIGITELSEIIAGRSSLTTGDVANVLNNLLDEMPRLMLMGKSVDLGLLGILHISFGSLGAATAEEFTTSLIRDPKIVFRASSMMKKKVMDNIKYVRVTEKLPTMPQEPENGS